MFGLLFLLLPVAVAYGWYMGQRSVRQNRKQKSNQLSRQYVDGLNLLLSDQSDKAVDLFIDLLQVNEETIETHLALGNLFRQRGEVDRAIRIHQNLIARPNLDIEQRQLALLQLSRDYQVAGLFDRAEAILLELVDEPEHSESALTHLLTLYQQTREWAKAIHVAEQLSSQTISDIQQQIAHFYCELAMQEETNGQLKRAYSLLKKALNKDRGCVRARVYLSQLLIEQNNFKEAIKLLEQLPELDIDMLSDYLHLVEKAYLGLHDTEGYRHFLERAMKLGGGATITVTLANMLETENIQMAERLVLDDLKRHPTMRGFHQLIGYHVRQAEPGPARQSLQLLQDLVAHQLLVRPHYKCHRCGFSSHAMYWHCPSCKSWGSIKPIRGLDGE
ncbi:lipopolysaccharide assembly protein LapB [Celerinatantimonas sp. YJH-8]|uniref:lipopolysaccharide assembly protein LapB n=1 Tax=Celerinatantimonas sp. YJH-8 TaxID=3228714 RepID=UPI0038C20C8B